MTKLEDFELVNIKTLKEKDEKYVYTPKKKITMSVSFPREFFTEQMSIAIDIFDCKHKYIHLFAQIQSGKTGAMIALAMMYINLGLPVYVMCAFPDTSLQDQIKEEFKNSGVIILRKYEELHIDNNFGLSPIPGLFLVDESHFGTGIDSITSQTVKRAYKIGYKVVLVTATGANHLYSVGEGVNPQIFRMKLPEGYRGADWWLSQKNVKFFDNVKESLNFSGKMFKEALIRLTGFNAYLVVRIQTQKHSTTIKKRAKMLGMDVVDMHSKINTFDKSFFKKQPNRPTIVLIYERFSAGCVIHKEHIVGWWEKDRKANDTAIQSFRMAGFDLHDNLFLYMNEEHLVKYVEFFENPERQMNWSGDKKPSNFTKTETSDGDEYDCNYLLLNSLDELPVSLKKFKPVTFSPSKWKTKSSLLKLGDVVSEGKIARGFRGIGNQSRDSHIIIIEINDSVEKAFQEHDMKQEAKAFRCENGKFMVSYFTKRIQSEPVITQRPVKRLANSMNDILSH